MIAGNGTELMEYHINPRNITNIFIKQTHSYRCMVKQNQKLEEIVYNARNRPHGYKYYFDRIEEPLRRRDLRRNRKEHFKQKSQEIVLYVFIRNDLGLSKGQYIALPIDAILNNLGDITSRYGGFGWEQKGHNTVFLKAERYDDLKAILREAGMCGIFAKPFYRPRYNNQIKSKRQSMVGVLVGLVRRGTFEYVTRQFDLL